MTLRIGTRGSRLARAQTDLVARALGVESEVVVVRTAGDATDRPIPELGDGVFVTAIEDALRRGEIDVAVHSLKDLPTEDRPGLVIAAIPAREDARDVLVTRSGGGLATLPATFLRRTRDAERRRRAPDRRESPQQHGGTLRGGG